MIRFGPLVRTAVLLLGMAVFTGACNGDSDPLTLEEYPSTTVAETARVAACLAVVDIAMANDIHVSVACAGE